MREKGPLSTPASTAPEQRSPKRVAVKPMCLSRLRLVHGLMGSLLQGQPCPQILVEPPPHPDSQAGAVGTAVPRDLITHLRFCSLQDQVLVFKIERRQGIGRKTGAGERQR